MQCPTCGTINPAQARFCMGCGKNLVVGVVCSHCQTVLPLQARFCYHCGTFVAQRVTGFLSQQPTQQEEPLSFPASGLAIPKTPDDVHYPAEALGSPKELDYISSQPPMITPTYQLPPARSLEEMQTSLLRYLPKDLYEPLERRPKEKDLELVREHLQALLGAVKTYLPLPVIQNPQRPGEPAGGMYQGVFLFGDVSGFTPLSEKLKALGQVGAEQITSLINELFTDLVTVLFDHGGTLLKFGGDALLGLFPANTEEEIKQCALQAAQAGLAMQEVLKKEQFSEIDALGEKRSLQIKCGISAGPYFAAHIGTQPSDHNPNGTMAFVTTGLTVNLAEDAEGHAHPGQVAMTRIVADLLADLVEWRPAEREPDEAYCRLISAPLLENNLRQGLDQPEPPEGEVNAQITYLVDRLNYLTPYLSDELIQRIVTNPRDVRIAPEHRPVTVMFANYKGISRLIEKMGDNHPELITHHLNNYFVHMASIVEKYEGTLARMDQYAVGDRLVIFFGAPRAHEDDPVRAIYTALEMQEAVRKNFSALRTPTGVYRFEQRIGINTGHLFAGNVGHTQLRQEYTLMGDDINMAARLMSNAPWQEIYISWKTKEQVEAYFDLEDRGELKVKGKEIRIPTFAVSGRRGDVGRTRGLASGESPLTGREVQLQQLIERGKVFLKRRGQIVSLMGNSGLGKTRLLREFRNWVQQQEDGNQVQWIEARALSFSEHMGYWMAAQMMRGLLGVGANASSDDILYQLGELGEQLLGEDAMEATPYLAHLMGLDLGEEWAWVTKVEPKVRQKQILWATAQMVSAAAQKKPILIALDDLHWADEASLMLFEYLLRVTDQAQVMFCMLYRPLRDKGCWKLRDKAAGEYPHRYLEIELEPLTQELSAILLAKLLPGATFDNHILADILDKSTGNPFYLEEVVRSLQENQAVIEDPNTPGAWIVTNQMEMVNIPVSLHAAIIARIDRLTEDARLALQTASVIGRQFRLELLRSLSQAEAEIELWLAQLERGGLVKPSDLTLYDPTYTFPDTLVQEVAYDSLLVQNRQQLHSRIAQMLEEVYADNLEQNCELLAYHFDNSADKDTALKYLLMAARQSERKYANQTAIDYYQKALKIQRSQEDLTGQANTLYAMGVKAYEIGDYPQARQWLEESAKIWQELDNRASEAWSVMYLGMVDLKQANYAASQQHHTKALENARERQDRFQEGIHLTNLARVRLRLGQYDQALQLFEESLAIKQSNNDLAGQGFAYFYMGMIYIYQQRLEEAAQAIQKSIQMWEQVPQNTRGLCYCDQGLGLLALSKGQHDTAVDYFQKALNACEKLVLRAETIENLSHLSQALLSTGNKTSALDHSLQAIQLLEQQKDVEEAQQIYFNHYRVLRAMQDADANQYLQKAIEEMQHQAGLIPNPEERRIFLTQTRVNAEIQNAALND